MSKTKKDMPIGEAFEKLEKIADEFEAGEIDLDKAMPRFKEAVELSTYLKGRLSEIENQIEQIDVDEMGEA